MGWQKIILTGLLIENEKEDIPQIVAAFANQDLNVQYVDRYKTLPGQGGDGGRSDLMFEMDMESISRGALHPWHLNGMFRWAEDYYDSSKDIIPTEKIPLFKEDLNKPVEFVKPE